MSRYRILLMKVLKQGGRLLIIMLVLLVVVISLQNLMPMGITRLMGVDPLIGMATGSISMTGGHGTAGGFASVLEYSLAPNTHVNKVIAWLQMVLSAPYLHRM